MSQKTILAVAVLVAALILGGYFAFRSGGTTQNTNTGASSEESEETSGGDRKMSFADLIRQGGSYRCTVNHSVQGIESAGVTYMSNEMVRGEFSTEVEGFSIDSYLIVRDGYTYTWTSMAPGMGYKVAVADQGASSSDTSTSGDFSSFDPNQIGEYDCDSWTADASLFALPAGVTFTEI